MPHMVWVCARVYACTSMNGVCLRTDNVNVIRVCWEDRWTRIPCWSRSAIAAIRVKTHTQIHIHKLVFLPNLHIVESTSHQDMSNVIRLGFSRPSVQGCSCLRREAGGGSRLVKRGSGLKCSRRRKLTQTSPKTSCLRVSLRQGNLSGAKKSRTSVFVGSSVSRQPMLSGEGFQEWMWEGLWWTRRYGEDIPRLFESAPATQVHTHPPPRTHTHPYF